MSEENILLGALALCLTEKKRKKYKKRRWWRKKWLLKRNSYSHVNLLEELRLYPVDWRNCLRMDESIYVELLSAVTSIIQTQEIVMRSSITPHERLSATLRFLATGRSYEDLKFSTVISPQALGRIIPETCAAIYTVFAKDYLKFPKTERDWQSIAESFEEKWNFPHCLGGIDGKHVQIVPPANSGSYFHNYKGFHSMMLMTVANANYVIIYCNFGTNGRIPDGGVLNNTKFYEKIKTGNLKIPKPETLHNSELTLPYVFVGDDAFSLGENLLQPFPQTNLSKQKAIFNYRLSRARRIIENVFGILAARFRIFHTAINVNLETIEKIVTACYVLHNFLRSKCPQVYTPTEHLDLENHESGTLTVGLRPTSNDFTDLQQSLNNRSLSQVGKVTREHFMNYFNNEGAVNWQNKATEKYSFYLFTSSSSDILETGVLGKS